MNRHTRQRLFLFLGFAVWCVTLVAAATGSEATSGTERARIQAERAQAQSRFSREEAMCYQRFSVNDCLQEASVQRREALGDLRRQEIFLHDAERKRKGADQVRRMEEKSVDGRPSATTSAATGQQRELAVQGEPAEKVEKARTNKSKRVSVKMAPRPGNFGEKQKSPPWINDGKSSTPPVVPSQLEREQARDARATWRDKKQADRRKPMANPLPVPE